MYVCMCLCVYVCVRMYVHIYMHACMHAGVYVCMHACMHACMNVSRSIDLPIYLCTYVHMHPCMYVCLFVRRGRDAARFELELPCSFCGLLLSLVRVFYFSSRVLFAAGGLPRISFRRLRWRNGAEMRLGLYTRLPLPILCGIYCNNGGVGGKSYIAQ